MSPPNEFATLRVWAGAILGAVYLWLAAPPVWTAIFTSVALPVSSAHSTDSYLSALAGGVNGTARISQLLEPISPTRPLLLVLRANNAESGFLAGIVSYLAWPREITPLRTSEAEMARDLGKRDPASFGAIVFCGLKPPPFIPHGQVVGEEVTIVSLQPKTGAAP